MVLFVNGMLVRDFLDLLIDPEPVDLTSPGNLANSEHVEPVPDLIDTEAHATGSEDAMEAYRSEQAYETEIMSHQLHLLNCANQRLLSAHRRLQIAADQSRSCRSLSMAYTRYLSPPSLMPIEWISNWNERFNDGAVRSILPGTSNSAARVVTARASDSSPVPDLIGPNGRIIKETKRIKKWRTRSTSSQKALDEEQSSSDDEQNEWNTVVEARGHASVQFRNRRRPKGTSPCKTPPTPSTGRETTAVEDIAPVPVIATVPGKVYKIILMGDSAVGKTSILTRLCDDTFMNDKRATFGMDMKTLTIRVDRQNFLIQLWDTAGQERFRSLSKTYYRRADGVLLVYDCTREQSFINVRGWINSLEDNLGSRIPIMLCGNKVDMREEADRDGRKIVTCQEGQTLARKYNALFLETSAKDGYNVYDTLVDLVGQIVAHEPLELKDISIRLHTDKGKHRKFRRPCCH